MSAYCDFDILKITDSEKMAAYRSRALAIVEQHGGRYLIVGGQFHVVAGNWQSTFPVSIEFPSLEQVHASYNLEDSAQLKAP